MEHSSERFLSALSYTIFVAVCSCPKVEKKDLQTCMAEKPSECETFRYALFQCRKGQLDARTRIQGNKGY